MLRIERYQKGRYWAIYKGEELVVVTLYKRGAQEVLQRLQACPGAGKPPAATQPPALTRQTKAAAPTSKGGLRDDTGIITDLQRRLEQLEHKMACMCREEA